MSIETRRISERSIFMTVSEHWTESLRCPACGLAGVAKQKKAAVNLVVYISEGFKCVSSQFGDTFHCESCNRPANEIRTANGLKFRSDPLRSLSSHPRVTPKRKVFLSSG